MSFVWLTKDGWISTFWTTLFVVYCFTALPLLVFAAAFLLNS
jgi:Na+(H+)/acetate symporter ActP